MKRVCVGCKWAEWQMTGGVKPRIKHNVQGSCRYPLPELLLPLSVPFQHSLRKSGIWTDEEGDCPVREEPSK